jgi:hypothetical protein
MNRDAHYCKAMNQVKQRLNFKTIFLWITALAAGLESPWPKPGTSTAAIAASSKRPDRRRKSQSIG